MSGGIGRIVVGVDGSQNSGLALAWAADLAASIDAEVVAVHALGLLVRVDDDRLESSQRHRREIRDEFENQWCAALDRPGLRASRLVVDGNPVSALLAVADERDVELIVVGSRGVGGFPGLMLGSTGHQLVQHSSRPVAVIPPAWASRAHTADGTTTAHAGHEEGQESP